ncbi:MAG: CoA transferase [Betaproteobacteria bacterium]|nr:CoA transferase [Betaproteobacteria bacterium]
MTLPLAGVRIIAVEQYGAGPWGSLYLADLGAEVIKIENPRDGGDVGRGVGPHFFGPRDSHFFQTFNRNKKSVTLDLKADGAREVLHDLARSADALLDNLRGDLPGALGVTYEHLQAANRRIVCAHLSAYGRDGPRAAWPGYDYLMQAETGLMSMTGEPDGPPCKFGVSIVDLVTGLTAAFALLAALTGARATGVGRDIDVSLFDVALHNLNYPATWYLNAGVAQGREARSAHPSLTPSQLFRTRDGWIMIMCNKERFWQALANELGCPEWIADARFADYAARLANRAPLQRMLDEALQRHTTAHWLQCFAGKVPAAPVNDIAQALESEFVRAHDNVRAYRYGDDRVARMVANPVRVGGAELPQQTAPGLGAHTDEVLAALGYDRARIAELRRRGVV